MNQSLVPVRYEHVVVPLDGSALGLASLPTARALADLFAAQLVTVTVGRADQVDALRADVRDSIGDDPTIAIETVIGDDPVAGVVTRAKQLSASLVCMSTHGRGRVGGALLGSVTRQILQACPVPIVTVGPQADRPPFVDARTGHRPSSWPEPLSRGGVAACVDGTTDSETVLPVAAGWAQVLEVEMSIVTVTDSGDGTLSGGVDDNDPRRYVEALAQRWGAVVATTSEVIVDPVSVAEGINAYVGRRSTALVALTTHARSGLDRVRLGATAADIVRRSTAPTLVLPLPGR